MLKIRDLIDVPDVKTVIQLSETRDLDPEDPVNRVDLEKLIESFILTDDVREILQVILTSFSQVNGRGFFVAGNYGSGKSHFLSVISLLIRHCWAWRYIIQQDPEFSEIHPKLQHKKYLTVLVPLTDFGSDIPLEDIIWHEIELNAAVSGIPLTLSHSERFIALFNRYILPVHADEFAKFIETRFGKEYPWDRICRDDLSSAHTLVYQFQHQIKELLPFRLIPDHRLVINDLEKMLHTNGFHGIVLIIDELSEYLKSKSDPKVLNQDARFLQFLGEASEHHPIWIIASLQETIDHIADIDDSVFKKIKARYSQRLRLTSKHLRDIVSKRLVRHKNPEATKKIGDVYQQLSRSLGNIPITQPEFVQIYPVHPDTVELLDKNSDIFSQRRGVVDFLSTRIKGKPSDNIQGILDEPADHLLTPDIIFDHFVDRIAESPQYMKFFRIYIDHFDPRISLIFTDTADAEAARKLIKVLILLQMSPFNERRNAKDLACMILFRALDTSLSAGEINYQYIRTNILEKLYESAGHLKLSRGLTSIEDVFEIDISTDLTDTIETQIRKISLETAPLSFNVVDYLFSSLAYGPFPFSFYYNRFAIRDSIRWDNTFRKVLVRICHFQNLTAELLSETRRQTENAEIDLVLFIAEPHDYELQLTAAQQILLREPQATAKQYAFVLPHISKKDLDLTVFSESYAIHSIISQLNSAEINTGQPFLEKLKNRVTLKVQESHRILIKMYQSISLLVISGKTEINTIQADQFDQWLSVILREPLNLRYPDHHRIAPKIEIGSRIMIDQTFDRFILPGKISTNEGSKEAAVLAFIKTVMLPAGLAIKSAETYLLTASHRSPSARAIMQWIPPAPETDSPKDIPTIDLYGLFKTAAISTYGFSKPIFELAVLTLLRKGYLRGFKSNIEIDCDQLQLPLFNGIDRIARGNLIPVRHRLLFSKFYKAVSGRQPKEWDIDTQNECWTKIVNCFGHWQPYLKQWERFSSILEKQFQDYHIETSDVMLMIKKIYGWSGAIDPDKDALSGIKKIIEVIHLDDDFEGIISNMKKLVSFFDISHQIYLDARTYLHDTRLVIPKGEKWEQVRELWEESHSLEYFSDALVFESGLRKFLEAFDRFSSQYRSLYEDQHQSYYGHMMKFDYTSVFLSMEYRVFQKLSQIRVLGAQIEIERMNRFIEGLKSGVCQRSHEIELAKSPVCSCGFSLQKPGIKIITPVFLIQRIGKRIPELIALIRTEPLHNQILLLLEKTTETIRESLECLLKATLTDVSGIQALERALNELTVDLLNRHLVVHRNVIQRRIDDLEVMVCGKTLTSSQLREIFEQWLDGDDPIQTADFIQVE